METFGTRLMAVRRSKALSQKELAEKMKVHQATISQWENGNQYPDVAKLTILCKFLEISMDYLVRGMTIRPPESNETFNYMKELNKLKDEKIMRLEEELSQYKLKKS